MESIVIATIKSWNLSAAKEFAQQHQKNFKVHVVSEKDALTEDLLSKIRPTYIFFPHWSWLIPESIFKKYTCVVFHMTDLPFGRGGSPLQNLLTRGITKTTITALQVNGGIDTGPIFLKQPFSLAHGNADELLQHAAEIIFTEMIPNILKNRPQPVPQKGEATLFKRRKPEESDLGIADLKTVDAYYNFVRMLDGEGYPPAFIPLADGFILQLKNATLKDGVVQGEFILSKQ